MCFAVPAACSTHLCICFCRRVEKGSWIVKQAVGQNTPVLLGKKLTTKYFTGPNYVEVRPFISHQPCWQPITFAPTMLAAA